MNKDLICNTHTHTYIYIYIYSEGVIVLPLASIASLFVVELRSRLPLNGCM